MRLHKADVIIVLGRGVHSDGTIPQVTKHRAEKAVELFKRKLAPTIIISAGYWGFARPIPKNTEAKPMREIIIKKGTPNSKVLFRRKIQRHIWERLFYQAYC